MKHIHSFCLFLLSVLSFSFILTSCNDTPEEAYYYTAKGVKRPEMFSKFVEIINKSRMVSLDLLGTYGSYTVFAPTDEAIDLFLAGRGLSSVDELSVEDCDTIAATHIIEQSYFTYYFSDATLPTMNMLDRYLTITCEQDTTESESVPINYYINRSAQIIHRDDSVENGVVHTIDHVINAATEMLPDYMLQDSTISLFTQALFLTHMDDSLRDYIDENYHCSVDSFAEGVCHLTGSTVDNVSYMEKRYICYTAFAERCIQKMQM